jgi:hypothetical protein
VLSGIRVFDSSLVEIRNPTFVSASGAQFSTSGIVPEPVSALLIPLGIAVIAVARFPLGVSRSDTQ